MSRACKITVSQFFCVLFLSRIVVNITYNPYLNGSGELIDHILSCVVSCLITFIMFIPIYYLYNKYNNMSILDHSKYLMGKFSVVIAFIFLLYFLWVAGYSLTVYTVFMQNVVMPYISVFIVCISVMIVSTYAAMKGIEGLARASVFLLILALAAIIFLIFTLIPSIDPLNFTPLLYDGNYQFMEGVNIMLSRTSCIALIAIFIPFIKKGKFMKGFLTWNIGIYLLMIVLIITIVGSQGDFLKTHIFPIYAAFNSASLGALKRMDIFYLGIWTSGLFVKVAINLLAFSLCASHIFGKKSFKTVTIIGGIAIGLIAVILSMTSKVKILSITGFLPLLATIIVSFVIPILIIVIYKLKKGSKENEKQ